jgi:hypothetical protein
MFVKRLCAPLFAAMAMLSMSGCLSMTSYVDPTLGDLKPADRVQVAEKRPVQFIFAFQTSGAVNSNATSALNKMATEYVTNSGLFSEVSSKPVSGGAMLSVTVNNVPQENAAASGITTGLTFGLAGSTVADYYVGTAKYTAGSGAPTATAQKKHTLYSTIGAAAAPQGLTASKSTDEAVTTIMRQLFEHMLNDIAKDPAFKPAPQVSQRVSISAAG